jgi:O-antigen/teichoic acid export membrane protein
VAKDILKSSISYTVLGFLPLSFAFIFTPVYLTYMDEAEYGLLNLFMLYTGILAQIYNLGVSQSFTFIYWDVYKDKEELKKLISSTLGLLIVFQIVFILLGLFFGENLLGLFVKSNDKFTFNPFFITALFFSAFMVYYEMFLYYFRNQGNLKAFSILSISTLFLLTIGTLIGVVWLDLKAVGAVFGRTAGYGIVVLFLLIFMIYKDDACLWSPFICQFYYWSFFLWP